MYLALMNHILLASKTYPLKIFTYANKIEQKINPLEIRLIRFSLLNDSRASLLLSIELVFIHIMKLLNH